jgi:hypothetical protein
VVGDDSVRNLTTHRDDSHRFDKHLATSVPILRAIDDSVEGPKAAC